MISQNISKQIADALKSHDQVRLSTLRLLSSAFNYERINKQHELTDDEEQEVVRREAKKRKDAIEIYKKAGEHDRADKEQKELAILEEFLPKQLSDEELIHLVEATIHEVGAMDPSQTGRIIGAVMHKANGRTDGTKVAEIVRAKLSK